MIEQKKFNFMLLRLITNFSLGTRVEHIEFPDQFVYSLETLKILVRAYQMNFTRHSSRDFDESALKKTWSKRKIVSSVRLNNWCKLIQRISSFHYLSRARVCING